MVLDMEEEGTTSPILIHEKTTFVYIKHKNLYRIQLIVLDFVTTPYQLVSSHDLFFF